MTLRDHAEIAFLDRLPYSMGSGSWIAPPRGYILSRLIIPFVFLTVWLFLHSFSGLFVRSRSFINKPGIPKYLCLM